MKKNAILFIIFLIMILNAITFLLILFYWDPFKWTETVQKIWLASFIWTFTVFLSCFLWIVIYFIKKTWYSWEIYIKNIFSSLRQGFLISVSTAIFIYFEKLWIFELKTVSLILLIWILLELTFKNLETK